MVADFIFWNFWYQINEAFFLIQNYIILSNYIFFCPNFHCFDPLTGFSMFWLKIFDFAFEFLVLFFFPDFVTPFYVFYSKRTGTHSTALDPTGRIRSRDRGSWSQRSSSDPGILFPSHSDVQKMRVLRLRHLISTVNNKEVIVRKYSSSTIIRETAGDFGAVHSFNTNKPCGILYCWSLQRFAPLLELQQS